MTPVPLDHSRLTSLTVCCFTHSSALVILAIAQGFWSTLFISIALFFSFSAEDFHVSQVSDVRPSLEFLVHGIDLDGNGDGDVDRDSYPIGHWNESTPSATNSTSGFHLLLSAPESPGPATQILHPCLSFASFYFWTSLHCQIIVASGHLPLARQHSPSSGLRRCNQPVTLVNRPRVLNRLCLLKRKAKKMCWMSW